MKEHLARSALPLILLLALLVRLWGIDYGLPCTYARPDEDRLIETALKLSWQDLNPHYFIWPSLPFYLTRVVLELGALVAGAWQGTPDVAAGLLYGRHPSLFHLLLRVIFCGLGVGTVWALYRAGRRLFSPEIGLLAALFLALSFLHARESHFAMLDVPATLLALLCLGRACDVYRHGRRADYLWAGLWAGLAVATKYYAVCLLPMIVAAHLLRKRTDPAKGIGHALFEPRFLAAVGLAVLVLPLTSPYALLDFARFRHELADGIAGPQFFRGFDLLPNVITPRGWLYHPLFSLRYALGLPLEMLCFAGLVVGAQRAWRREPRYVLIAAFLIPFALLLAFQKACFMRYVMMTLPFLCLAGAEFTVQKRRPLAIVLVALVAISEPSYRIVRHNRLLSQPDTRVTASAWMLEHIPREAKLLFPRPTTFGRPFAYTLYPRRDSVPEYEDPNTLSQSLPLSSLGMEYLVLDEHWLPYSALRPRLRELLTHDAELIYELKGYREDVGPAVYDAFDAYYVPLGKFGHVLQPGPTIRIYRYKEEGTPCRQDR